MASSPQELQELPEDWDGYKARRITDAAVLTAAAVEYVPSSDGGIQIELHAGGSDVEIEIGPDGKIDTVLWGRRG